MRTLEISAQFLAPLQIPHATLSRSLHLSALHFPSAKFGERNPPSGLVCLGREHAIILFYFIPGPRTELARCRRGPMVRGRWRLWGDFSGRSFPEAARLFHNT